MAAAECMALLRCPGVPDVRLCTLVERLLASEHSIGRCCERGMRASDVMQMRRLTRGLGG